MNEFSTRLRYLRYGEGLTQPELSKKLGFGSSTIQKYEYGVEPTLGKLINIADFFGVTLDYLTGHETKIRR